MTNKNFTQKAQEAIQSAQALALEYGSPQIEQALAMAEHLEARLEANGKCKDSK